VRGAIITSFKLSFKFSPRILVAPSSIDNLLYCVLCVAYLATNETMLIFAVLYSLLNPFTDAEIISKLTLYWMTASSNPSYNHNSLQLHETSPASTYRFTLLDNTLYQTGGVNARVAIHRSCNNELQFFLQTKQIALLPSQFLNEVDILV
jgi:hypothetical protein